MKYTRAKSTRLEGFPRANHLRSALAAGDGVFVKKRLVSIMLTKPRLLKPKERKLRNVEIVPTNAFVANHAPSLTSWGLPLTLEKGLPNELVCFTLPASAAIACVRSASNPRSRKLFARISLTEHFPCCIFCIDGNWRKQWPI